MIVSSGQLILTDNRAMVAVSIFMRPPLVVSATSTQILDRLILNQPPDERPSPSFAPPYVDLRTWRTMEPQRVGLKH